MKRQASGVRRQAWTLGRGKEAIGSRKPGASPRASRLTPHARGYTLVAVAIGMAILAILIAAVAPSVGTIMKREREQELIFRGKQYARAIGFFQRRYGRYPTELKELYENRPRTIRQLWKEPMCDCADWYLIIQGTPDAVPLTGGGPAPRPATPPGAPGVPAPPHLTPTPGIFGNSAETKNVGNIVGVRSKVHKEALQEWRGQKYYDQWRFLVGDADRETVLGRLPPGAPPFQQTPIPQ